MARRIYTPAQIRFLAQKIHGRSYEDMRRLFNKHFDLAITFGQMKSLLRHHKLTNGFGHGNPTIPHKRKYLDVHIKYLKKNVTGRSYADLAKNFSGEFGFTVTQKQLSSLLKRYNLTNGRDCRIKSGNIPFNKGMKGHYAPGCEKGWFKKGNHPWTYMPVGSERDVEGYLYVKIADPNKWKAKHRIIWERVNGPVPKGYVIIFADGNKLNMSLKNLLLVHRKELLHLNQWGLYSTNSELTNAGLSLVKIKHLVTKRKRDSLTTGKKSLVIIDNNGKRIYVIRDDKTKRYYPVRETGRGIRRLRAGFKTRKTRAEAQRDLKTYALKRGWQKE